MIYKFKSPATADHIMLGPHGDELLRLIGREPAAKGIIEPDQMPRARAALQAAIDAEEAAPPPADADGDDAAAEQREAPVGLRRRLWPMIQMLERAEAAGEPVVWGV